MLNKKILEKTLTQLHDEFPEETMLKGKPPFSNKEKELAQIPLKDFTNEHLYFWLNRNVGLIFLIPLAIEVLSENPFVNSRYYNGDLLGAVLYVIQYFWQENPQFYQAVEEILEKAESLETEEAKEVLTIFLPQIICNFRKLKETLNLEILKS